MFERNYKHILQELKAFQRPSVLMALAELDLATTLLRLGNCSSAQELAEVTGCDCRAMDILLDASAALGYFRKSSEDGISRYSVPEPWHQLLDSTHPHSVISYICHMGSLQRSWINLARALREGRPQSVPSGILSSDEERVSFIMAMNSIGQGLHSRVLDALRGAGAMPMPTARILDVGGGAGAYAEAFLKALPEARLTLFDLPSGVAQARKRVGGNRRIKFVIGDFMKDELPSGMDYAWVSAIIHQMNRQECIAFFGKIFRALNHGAIIAVRDYVMAENRLSPVEGTLFGINMLMRTATGRVYTYEEIKTDLEQAGFTGVRYAVPESSMGAIVTAVKAPKRLEQGLPSPN